MSNKMEDGGPAFPRPVSDVKQAVFVDKHICKSQCGMSLRDWFAGMALNALLSKESQSGDVASHAYCHADQMLEKRCETEDGDDE